MPPNYNPNPQPRDVGISKALQELPEKISKALEDWDIAKIKRRKKAATLHLDFKINNPNSTTADLEAMVNENDEFCDLCLKEAVARANYKRLDEELMAQKKLGSMRNEFYGT